MTTDQVTYPNYTVYDLLEHFDDYFHDALKCVEDMDGPADAVKQQQIARDILNDFGAVPDGMSIGRYQSAIVVAVYDHWHQR